MRNGLQAANSSRELRLSPVPNVSGQCAAGGGNEVFISTHNAYSWGYYDMCTQQWTVDVRCTLRVFDSTHRAFNCSLLPSALRMPTIRRTGACVGHSVAGQIVGSGARVHVALGDMQCAVARHWVSVGTAGRWAHVLAHTISAQHGHIVAIGLSNSTSECCRFVTTIDRACSVHRGCRFISCRVAEWWQCAAGVCRCMFII